MKQLLLKCAVVVLVGGCGGKKKSPEEQVEVPVAPKVEAKNPEPPKVVSENLIANPIVEKEIRNKINKPTGELTKEDLEPVKTLFLFLNELTQVPKDLEKLEQLTELHLNNNKLGNVKGLEKLGQLKYLHLENNDLTNLKGLEKLTHLRELDLNNNPDLTKVQVDQLQKALPNCKISSNPTK